MEMSEIAVAVAVLMVVTIAAMLAGSRTPGAAHVERFGGGDASESPVVLQYFRMQGCPHCERFDSVWSEIKASGPRMPGVTFEQHDAGGAEAARYGVKSFPHIQLVASGEPHVYDGRREAAAVEAFVEAKRRVR